MELSLRDLNKKIEEQNLKLSDFEASKRRISLENGELLSQLQQQNAAVSLLAQAKSALVANLDEQRALVEEVITSSDFIVSIFLSGEQGEVQPPSKAAQP